MLQHPAYFLGAQPGLGKTSITLAAAQVLLDADAIDAVLVIAPLHVVYNVWPSEVTKWDEFRGLKLVTLHGSQKAKRLKEPADIYLINPEGLAWLDAQVTAGNFELPCMLVVDESTKFKNSQSKRFKILRKWIDAFERRYCLTGTPMPNTLLDLFGQFFILDGGERLGRYVTHFRNKWFFQSGFGGYTWTPNPGAQAEIEERIGDISSFLDADDLIDMPQLIENKVFVRLPIDVMKRYAQLEDEFLIEVKGATILARNGGALTSKLRQLLSGAIYTDEKDWMVLHEAKLDALASLLADREGHPTLVGYEFRHSLAQMEERFGKQYRCGYAGAGVSAGRVKATIEAWNRGEIDVLFAHPASLGHGVNLQSAGDCVIWYGPTYDFELHDQFVRRVYRQGQKKRVIVHTIMVPGTIDELVYAVLGRKERSQRGLIDAIKAQAEKHRA